MLHVHLICIWLNCQHKAKLSGSKVNSESILYSKLLDMNISDHMGVLATRKKVWTKPNKIEFKGRSYRNYSKEDFQDELGDTNWENFYRTNDPNVFMGLS